MDTMPEQSTQTPAAADYEAPHLERHGRLADITRSRLGTGGDLGRGKKGTGDPD